MPHPVRATKTALLALVVLHRQGPFLAFLAANAIGITPLARIVTSSVSALAPEIMGVGPIEAVRRSSTGPR